MTPLPENKPSLPPAPPPRSKSRKRWWKIALGIVIALFLLILLLPTLLSSVGKNFLLGEVNSRIAGTVNADSISLGWFSGASIRNLSVKDPDGKVILTVPTVDTGLSLSNALLDSTRHLDILIRADNATLIANSDGTNNLSRAFAPKSSPPTSPAASAAQPTTAPAPPSAETPSTEAPAAPMSVGNLIATFDVQITHITCQSPNAPTLSIDNTSLKGSLNTVTGDTKLTFAGTAKSADGKPTALSADIAGNFFTDGALKPLGEFTGNGQAAVHSLDLAAIAPLLATAGVPLQLTGTLDATAKLDQTAGKPSVNADLTVSQLTATGPALDGDTLKRDQVKATLQATLNGDSVDLQQLALTTQSLSAKINGTLQTSPPPPRPRPPAPPRPPPKPPSPSLSRSMSPTSKNNSPTCWAPSPTPPLRSTSPARPTPPKNSSPSPPTPPSPKKTPPPASATPSPSTPAPSSPGATATTTLPSPSPMTSPEFNKFSPKTSPPALFSPARAP
jgi:hypothetical protein